MNARRFVILFASVAGLSACTRAHLTPTYGRAYHQIFAAQDANPDHKNTKSVHGLDSQEAAIIAGSYRHALAPVANNSTNQQLVTTNNTGAGAMPVPTTSVPGGQ
ncbi:MAG TPA: hypothetical protein VHJ20_17180 [Polyangia bacterium]|nr:hypothetical protein [Polyangia bacterium]